MKTKFIKVSVEERLPGKDGRYFLWVDNPNVRHLNSEKLSTEYNMERNFFKDGKFKTFYDTTHYLQEIPDREDEMREMLEEISEQLREYPHEPLSELTEDKINKLLNELKQTT